MTFQYMIAIKVRLTAPQDEPFGQGLAVGMFPNDNSIQDCGCNAGFLRR